MRRTRIMGLDLGAKTIGVAISDELGWTAQALETLERGAAGAELDGLRRIIQAHDVQEIVVGHPLNMNGTAGPSARTAQGFAKRLETELGLRVHLWDERLSTAGAERVLLEADLSRAKRRRVIDRAAAAFILQGFLDFRARGGDDTNA